MAIRGAVATGNWSNVATWDGGVSLPGSGDTVVANNKTVTIDTNQNIGSGTIQTLAAGAFASGGGFTLASGVTLTANVLAGTSTCLTHSSGNGTVNGNVTGSAATATLKTGITFTSSGTLTINGNLQAGATTTSHGLYHNSPDGTVNVVGTCTGGANSGCGAQCNSTGFLNITGNVIAGTGGSTSYGLGIGSSLATVVINGNLVPSTATIVVIVQIASGTLTVNGNCPASTIGAQSISTVTSSMTLTINGNVTADVATSILCTTGTVTINGSITGSNTTSGIAGVTLQTSGSLASSGTTSGTISGGSATTSHGVKNTGTGSIDYKGNVLAGSSTGDGINMTSTGACTITGNVTSSATAFGLSNSSTGTITVNGTVTAGAFGPGIKRTSASDQKTIINGGVVGETSVGWPGVICGQLGKIVVGASSTQSHRYATDNAGAIGALRTLTTASGGGGGCVIGSPIIKGLSL